MPPLKRDISVCSCPRSTDNLSSFPELKEILPSHYKYNVCNWKREDADYFESRFRVNVATKMEVYEWLEKFSAATNTVFSQQEDFKCEEAIIFSYRCKHLTKDPPRKYEDIGFPVTKRNICPTRLIIILKWPAFVKTNGLQEDVHLHDFPATVIHHQHHNHLLEVQEVGCEKPFLSGDAEDILNSLNALEIQLQQSAAKSAGVENTAERPYHPEFQSYQEVLESLFPAKFAEEKNDFLLPPENHPFNFVADIDSFIRYFRANCKTNRSELLWIWPHRRYNKAVDMKMLPHNPVQELINQTIEKLWNLEEGEEK